MLILYQQSFYSFSTFSVREQLYVILFGSQTFLSLTKFLHKNNNICDIKLLYY
jgi:hypothetical protein